ncbi:hypothetical protein ACRALDRAFT_1080277 [Sodiomyces alcalophilus JCM 7366]|uniref:uncharacterized protein n=1 Tax=Sodiomyces alcalophilus JCM 7366 TaxID=591952 RepID=UPI0039B44A1F
MDVKDLAPGLDQLGSNLDDLEEALEPLIDNLADMSTELPLLDRAKLMTLTAYSIESLLFSALRLQGVDAVNHEVMTELKRVKQYFEKIQKAEEPPSQRSTTVNTEAATRILKADLSDNKQLKQKLEEKLAEERAKALLKSIQNKRPAPDNSPSATLSSHPKNKGRKT